MNTHTWIAVAFVACALVATTTLLSNAQTDSDPRTRLELTPEQNGSVRREMRLILESVSDVVAAIDNNDFKAVETSARRSGMSMAAQVEISLKKKLPDGFKKLGKSVHVGFDEIADAAQADEADRDKLISLLAAQLQRCVACHGAYRLE